METELRELLVRMDGLLRKGLAAEARRELDEFAAKHRPGACTAEFHAVFAQACLGNGDAAAARSAIERAIVLRPDWPDARHVHGLALRDLGLLDEAAKAIETALRLRPGNARACSNLGTIQLRRGLPQEAESAFRCALEHSPANESAWRGLAETLQVAGMDDAAIGAWRTMGRTSRRSSWGPIAIWCGFGADASLAGSRRTTAEWHRCAGREWSLCDPVGIRSAGAR
jgi:Tfp pilus assembly protein PilF